MSRALHEAWKVTAAVIDIVPIALGLMVLHAVYYGLPAKHSAPETYAMQRTASITPTNTPAYIWEDQTTVGTVNDLYTLQPATMPVQATMDAEDLQ